MSGVIGPNHDVGHRVATDQFLVLDQRVRRRNAVAVLMVAVGTARHDAGIDHERAAT